MDFKEFIQTGTTYGAQQEPWRAEKDEVISHWQSLPPNVPIGKIRAIPAKYKGPTFTFDGIRVSGSASFINAAMSRLKDLLTYEGGATRLQTIYKQAVDKKTGNPIPNSYVFYVQIKRQTPKTPKTK